MQNVTPLGQLLRDKLSEGAGSAPFRAAVVSFHSHVATYLNDNGYNAPDWALWLDIRGTAMAGKKVDAIKMLRTATVTRVSAPKPLPPHFAADGSTFCSYADRYRGVIYSKKTLGLLDAKKIIDLLDHDEYIFEDQD